MDFSADEQGSHHGGESGMHGGMHTTETKKAS